jgi:hypothetical protein
MCAAELIGNATYVNLFGTDVADATQQFAESVATGNKLGRTTHA